MLPIRVFLKDLFYAISPQAAPNHTITEKFKNNAENTDVIFHCILPG